MRKYRQRLNNFNFGWVGIVQSGGSCSEQGADLYGGDGRWRFCGYSCAARAVFAESGQASDGVLFAAVFADAVYAQGISGRRL